MPKRFTDTDKWKKPFIRGLQGAYKLFWLYLLDDCDHAGIWQVDFDVAQIRTGEKLDEKKAIELLGDRVEVFDNGSKWFLKDFIFFQYGELNEKNRLHLSVINILTKHKIGPYKPLPRGQGQGKGIGQGTRQGQGQGGGDEKLQDYDTWTQDIIDGNDFVFGDMFVNESIPPGPNIQFLIMDHRDLLSRYPKMRPPDQQAFRRSCLKHIRENYKKPINGQGKSINNSKSRIDEIVQNRHGPG
jgi:hypothetical protein